MGGRLPSGRAGDHKHLGRHEECAGSQALTWAAARPLLQSSSARASSAPPPPLVMTHGTGETLKRRAASAAAPPCFRAKTLAPQSGLLWQRAQFSCFGKFWSVATARGRQILGLRPCRHGSAAGGTLRRRQLMHTGSSLLPRPLVANRHANGLGHPNPAISAYRIELASPPAGGQQTCQWTGTPQPSHLC